MSSIAEQSARFLDAGQIAVAGASRDRSKYGNKVLRALVDRGFDVVAIHPEAEEVEGITAYPDVASAPKTVRALSIITPPAATEGIVHQAVEAGIEHIWMQPGAESESAVEEALASGANVLHDGPCILVALATRK